MIATPTFQTGAVQRLQHAQQGSSRTAMAQLIVIRHGARGHDCMDPLLYDHGVVQAEFMADYLQKRLADEGKMNVGLYSSM